MASVTSLISSVRVRIGDDDIADEIYTDGSLKSHLINASRVLSFDQNIDLVVDADNILHSSGAELTLQEEMLLEIQTAIEVVKAEKIRADREATSFKTEAMAISRTDRPRYIQDTLERLEADKARCLLANGYVF